jgi:hypothetical protein
MQGSTDVLERNRLRERLRSLSFGHGLVKVADLGGSPDQTFEAAFSNLSHAYLKDKAPKLLDYELGFQLIDKNEENTKAVGVFGFKLGSQYLYAPVFFLNGELKGHELLYIKNQDLFVPLKDNWVNYLLGRRPSVLGEGMNRNLSLVGVMPPNLYQLSRSPNKFASVTKYYCPKCGCDEHGKKCEHCGCATVERTKMASWVHEVMPDLAYFATQDVATEPKYAGLKTFPEFLKEAGETAFRFLVEKVGSEYPTVLRAVDTLYGPDMLTKLAQQLAAQRQAAAPTNSILKQGTLAMAGETPPGWNGGFQNPSVENGGRLSTGREAWDSSHVGRRRSEAQVGSLDDMGVKSGHYPGCGAKAGHYPGCGARGPAKPKAPTKVTRPRPVKHASIMKVAKPVGSEHVSEMKPRKVKVVTHDEINDKNRADLLHNLDKDERERLLKERIVVKDDRDDKEVTLAYNVQTEIKLQTPDRTNIYRLLVKPDTFKDCLVLFGPYDETGRNTFCTVVDLDTKRWVNIHPSRIWAESEYDDEAWREWFDGLKKLDSPPDKGDLYLVLTPWGQGTCPCELVESYGSDAADTDLYDVRFRSYADISQPFYQNDYPRMVRPFREGVWNGSRIRLTHQPGKAFKVTEGDVCVPDGARYLELKKAKPSKPDFDADSDDHSPEPSGTEPEPLQLGNLVDVQLALANQTKALHLYADGTDVTFDRAKKLNKVAALKELVLTYNLREKVARQILEEAERQGQLFRRSYTCLLKKAAPGSPMGDMVSGAPNSPPFPEPNIGYDPMTGSNVPTMGESEFNVKVPDMSASKTDRSIYYPLSPDAASMQVAQRAAQTGQREVFDTAMLGSMLKSVRQDSMVEKYLGDLTKGMDRLGRILFLFYWHGEEFEERYGKQDMPELEDGIRNAFEGVGDILWKLKQKTVDPYPDEGTDADLSEIANQ